MRPFPEIRSRSQVNNHHSSSGSGSSNGIESTSDSNHRLTNGSSSSHKDPIVTRSKSVKLRSGRKSVGRSPLKAQSPAKNYSSDSSNGSHGIKGKEIRSNGSSNRRRSKRERDKEDEDEQEKTISKSSVGGLYARHYKSYRRTGGGGLSSLLPGSRSADGNFSPNNCQRTLTSKRLRPYENHGVNLSPPGTSSRRSRVTFKSRSTISIEKRRNIGTILNNKKGRPKKLVSSSASSTTVTPLSSPTCSSRLNSDSANPNGKHYKDKGGKRRSALWVLNCEAEEFLFGETAADKHELELPPSSCTSGDSPPPKKRRRWRAGELKHLLETSPFLESKLRSSSSSSDSGRDSSNASPPPRKKNIVTESSTLHRRPRRLSEKRKVQLSFDLDRKPPQLKCSHSKPVRVETLLPPVISNLELLSPTSSIRSNYSSCREPLSVDPKTVQLRETLSSMPWRFSFEETPLDESWYATFSRPGDAIMSYMSFLSPYFEPVVLPYEMNKPFLRSRRKLPKNSRKSPRCHASTLAILSSETPIQSNIRNSIEVSATTASTQSAASASSTTTVSPADATLESIISIPVSSTSTSTTSSSMMSPFTKFVSENSIRLRTRSPSVKESATSVQQNGKRQDLSAQQYLWDSIQFLSDPYVVSLLAGGDEPESEPMLLHTPTNYKSRSRHSSNYNNNPIVCPVKRLVQNCEALERKASLRSCDSSSSSSCGISVNVLGGGASKESGTGASTKNVPLPKGSPRNHSHGTHVNGTSVVNNYENSSFRLLSLNGMSKSIENRSPNSEQRVHSTKSSSNHHSSSSNHTTTNNNSKTSSKVKQSTEHHHHHPVVNNFHRSKSPTILPLSKPGSPIPSAAESIVVAEGTNGRSRISTRKSPVVMVSDIFKNGTTKVKKLILEEELLFLGDGLPPLPSWPV